MNTFEGSAVEANPFKGKAAAILAQETHHDLFPKENWEHGDTKGDFLSVHLHLETTVLRQTFLIEFEV